MYSPAPVPNKTVKLCHGRYKMTFHLFGAKWIPQKVKGILFDEKIFSECDEDNTFTSKWIPCGVVRSFSQFDLKSSSTRGYGALNIYDGSSVINSLWCCQVITLQFSQFELEPSSTCGYDALHIYDGDSDVATQLGTYCGSTTPPELTSSGNTLYIQ